MRRLPHPGAASFEFFRTEIETGLTFADVAAKTSDDDKRHRSRDHAQEAHDTVVRFLPRAVLDPDQFEQIKEGLARLKDAIDQV